MSKTNVIAICGIPGSGKSSLVAKLASLLPNCRALCVDDYLPLSVRHADLSEWVSNGARFEDWNTPGLPEDVSASIADPDVTHIVLEEARGRCSPETASSITHLVYVAVPPDVGLARKALQISENHSDEQAVQYCRHYLHCLPGVIAAIESKIRPQADLTLDGMESSEALATRVIEEYDLLADTSH